jgi:beta-phosphoglucomutase
MILKACIFDLDGVLVDTARFHYLAWRTLAKGFGFEFTESDNERLKGVSRMDSLEILLEIGQINLSEPDKMKYADEKNQLYLRYIRKMTGEDVLPGVREFLSELKQSGILLALGSVSKNAAEILNRTGITAFFDAIVDGNMITRAKPHPEVFLTGARLLKTDPASCIVFEDAVAGIRAAHFAGMKCVGVGAPGILAEADLIIPEFLDLSWERVVSKLNE